MLDKSYYILNAILEKISKYLKAAIKARYQVPEEERAKVEAIIEMLNDIVSSGFEIGEAIAEREATTFKAYRE